MAFEYAPWFIGADNTLHSAEIARSVAYAAIGGADGIAGINDLKVTATSTPSGSVEVAPGVANMVSRYPGGAGQAYIGRIPQTRSVAIAPNNTSSPRYDLVYARILDPQYQTVTGFDPDNPNDTVFFTLAVFQGTTSTYDNISGYPWPGIPLAQITMPPNTATVTNAQITDARFLSSPKTHVDMETVFPGSDLNASRTGYNYWGSPFPGVQVPLWANVVHVTIHLSGIEYTGLNTVGTLGVRSEFGGIMDRHNTVVRAIPTPYTQRFSHTHVAAFSIPSSLRGERNVPLRLRAQQSIPAGSTLPTHLFQLDYQSALQALFVFQQSPE